MKKRTKKKIFIITNSTFQFIHYDKLKIKNLLNYYDVYILDFTKYYKAKPKIQKLKNFKNYLFFSNEQSIFDYITFKNPDLIIDSLGNNFLIKTWKIRNFIYKNNHNTLILSRGLQPKIFFSFIESLKIYLFNHKYFFNSLVNFLSKKIIKIVYSDVLPKYFISSALKSDNFKFQLKKYFLYSYDYGNYLTNKNKKKILKSKYALFIDENIVYHPDYHNSNYPRSPASERNYYKSLKKFFQNFEKKNKLKVVIALHPTTEKKVLKYFKDFKSYYNLTGRLVKDATIVLIHSSTTKHLAAIYGKPMIYLTSDEINQSWFRPHIFQNSKLFDSQLININDENTKRINLTISKVKYKSFINNYVMHPKFKKKKINFLKIVNSILKDE